MFKVLTIASIQPCKYYSKLISAKQKNRDEHYHYIIPDSNKFDEGDVGTQAIWYLGNNLPCIPCVFKLSTIKSIGLTVSQDLYEGMDVTELMYSVIDFAMSKAIA
jgi:hypothetical protein